MNSLLLLAMLLGTDPPTPDERELEYGFSTDGRFFLSRTVESGQHCPRFPYELRECAEVTAAFVEILDLRNGQLTRYLEEEPRYQPHNAYGKVAVKQLVSKTRSPDELERLLGEVHFEVASGRTSPFDAKTKAEITATRGQWEKGVFSVGLFPYGTKDLPSFVLTAGKGGALRWSGMPVNSIWPVWSPDKRRVAWVFERARSEGGNAIAFSGLKGPSIEIQTPFAERTPGVLQVWKTIDSLGFAVSKLGRETEERMNLKSRGTVVFAATGFEKTARAVAATIPGATVEPLVTPGCCDVVVSLVF